ncbi:MAG: SCO family protein [Bacteroidia bacterium]|nr:SCO family protein [Bacteroidia bacterium]
MSLNSVRFVFVLALLISACRKEKSERLLPIFGEKKFNKENGDTLYHKILPFRLTTQYGTVFSSDSIMGKIIISDFFFATCRSICPEMSKHMARLQKKFAADPDLVFLSHTVNPAHDTVEVLRAYAEHYGAIRGKWYLLTGNRDTIYALAKKSYLINALEDEEADQGFLHSELFVLVDKDGLIRGFYDGTSEQEMKRLEGDILTLKKEIQLSQKH